MKHAKTGILSIQTSLLCNLHDPSTCIGMYISWGGIACHGESPKLPLSMPFPNNAHAQLGLRKIFLSTEVVDSCWLNWKHILVNMDHVLKLWSGSWNGNRHLPKATTSPVWSGICCAKKKGQAITLQTCNIDTQTLEQLEMQLKRPRLGHACGTG